MECHWGGVLNPPLIGGIRRIRKCVRTAKQRKVHDEDKPLSYGEGRVSRFYSTRCQRSLDPSHLDFKQRPAIGGKILVCCLTCCRTDSGNFVVREVERVPLEVIRRLLAFTSEHGSQPRLKKLRGFSPVQRLALEEEWACLFFP